MIEELQELLPEVLKSIRCVLGYYPERDNAQLKSGPWESKIINKRKPHTYRAYRMFGDNRVCLHCFHPCEPDECFEHPHSWPAAMLVLKGEYFHTVGCSNTLTGGVKFIFRELVRPFSMYEMCSPFAWHKVQPTQISYTVMINGPEYEHKHVQTRTTKGKDLDTMDNLVLLQHLTVFEVLLTEYLDRHKAPAV